MKKNLCVLMIAVLMLSLTACGNSKSSSNEALNDDPVAQEPLADGDIEEYAGEGAVTGGIPTDEELAAREAEADSYSEEPEEIDYSDANVEMTETPSSSDTFISSDNFWQGDDYFDLEEYYWMNGAKNVGYTEDNKSHPPYAVFNGWRIDIAGSGCNAYYIQDWNNEDRPYRAYNVTGEFLNEAPSVHINADGAVIMRNLPEILDEVLPCLIERNDQDDPFENSELHYIHMY